MKQHRSTLAVSVAAATGVALAATAPASWAQGSFDEAVVYIEINATDGDAGFQGLADAEGWSKIQLSDPAGKKLFKGKAKKALKDQGMTEFFWESTEPECELFPLDQFLLRFPAGAYGFEAKTLTGNKLTSTATLTHNLPAAPEIVEPEQGEDAEEDPPGVFPGEAVIEWDEGEDLGECDIAGIEPGGEIVGWEVVVEPEDEEGDFRVLVIQLPADATSAEVSEQFLESFPFGTLFKFEITAIETSDNRTSSEGFFETVD